MILLRSFSTCSIFNLLYLLAGFLWNSSGRTFIILFVRLSVDLFKTRRFSTAFAYVLSIMVSLIEKFWRCPCGPGYSFQVLARPAFQVSPFCGLYTSIPHPIRRNLIKIVLVYLQFCFHQCTSFFINGPAC